MTKKKAVLISAVIKNDKLMHFGYGARGHVLLGHYYKSAFQKMVGRREGTWWASYEKLLHYGTPEEWTEFFDFAAEMAELDEKRDASL